MRKKYVHGKTSVYTQKFMQTLENNLFDQLTALGRLRGITLQQFLRAVIVPEWIREHVPDSNWEKEQKNARKQK